MGTHFYRGPAFEEHGRRYVKMPCNRVSLFTGASLGNLKGIRLPGLSERKGWFMWVPFLGPDDIKVLSHGAIWYFGKGTGLSWADIRLWGTKGPSVRPRCIRTVRARTQCKSMNNPCSHFVHFMTKVTPRNYIYAPVDPDSVISTALENTITYTGALPSWRTPNVPHPTPVNLTRKPWIRSQLVSSAYLKGLCKTKNCKWQAVSYTTNTDNTLTAMKFYSTWNFIPYVLWGITLTCTFSN